jgi:hypothetical protein
MMDLRVKPAGDGGGWRAPNQIDLNPHVACFRLC